MIAVSRVPLLTIIGLVCAGLTCILFGLYAPVREDLAVACVLTALIEWVVYFVLTLIFHAGIGGGRALWLGCGMMICRAILCMIGGLILTALSRTPLDMDDAMLQAWGGNLVSVTVQALIIMLITPHFLTGAAPGLITEDTRGILQGTAQTPGALTTGTPFHNEMHPSRETTPVGGFIQVFSFQELQSILRKSIGMEGYILYTSEGLVLWKDMPIRMDVDSFVAHLMRANNESAAVVEGFGLSRASKILTEAQEHYILNARLNSNFGLVMVFSNGVKVEDCWLRMGVMAKTAREFLQWRYSGMGALKLTEHQPSS